MLVYRIAKSLERARDLSGTGAFRTGGRWNSRGTYMLYTSMNSSLAYLENLVHFDEFNLPPDLYITTLELKIGNELIYELPDADYPKNWLIPDNLENKALGDEWISEEKHIGIKVRSAVNPSEYNYLLNPLFPGYHELVKILVIDALKPDSRLLRR